MFLATFIFLLVIGTESILWLGYAYLTALTYDLYSKVSTDQAVVRQRKYRKQVLQLRTELAQTSSQDQFAKWAKIRRKCDSATDSLEKTNSEIAIKRAAFEVKVKGVLYFVVHGSQLLTVMWFRKSPVFYLPHGWFGPAAWVLSLPFAPRGSVSVAVWFAACRRVCKTTASLVNDFYLKKKLEEADVTAASPQAGTQSSPKKTETRKAQ
ncbi:CHD5-like protein-domain-containing protein [Umbelopsis sp. AD052]|nr:CHD5-like protein-domain-containing protein [Umbelopsis sp. AD052]